MQCIKAFPDLHSVTLLFYCSLIHKFQETRRAGKSIVGHFLSIIQNKVVLSIAIPCAYLTSLNS